MDQPCFRDLMTQGVYEPTESKLYLSLECKTFLKMVWGYLRSKGFTSLETKRRVRLMAVCSNEKMTLNDEVECYLDTKLNRKSPVGEGQKNLQVKLKQEPPTERDNLIQDLHERCDIKEQSAKNNSTPSSEPVQLEAEAKTLKLPIKLLKKKFKKNNYITSKKRLSKLAHKTCLTPEAIEEWFRQQRLATPLNIDNARIAFEYIRGAEPEARIIECRDLQVRASTTLAKAQKIKEEVEGITREVERLYQASKDEHKIYV